MSVLHRFDENGRHVGFVYIDRPIEAYEYRDDLVGFEPPPAEGSMWPYWNGEAWELRDESEPPESPITLEEIKEDKWRLIKAMRTAKLEANFLSQGHWFQADPESKTNIIGAAQLAQVVGSSFTIPWTCADNTVVTLNQAQMTQVGVDLGIHINTMHAIGRTLRDQIDAATTPGAVEAVEWPS